MEAVAEPLIDAVGNDFSHVFHFQQFPAAGRGDGIERTEVPGYALGRAFPDVANAQREEQLLERSRLRLLQTVQEALCGFLPPALERHQLICRKSVEISDIPHISKIEKLFHRRVPGQHVHRLAAEEVGEGSLDLGRAAVYVRAVPPGLALVAHQRGAAVGAGLREFRLQQFRSPFGELHGGDFGNYLPAFLHIDIVAYPYVEQFHLVGVVQAGPLYHGSRKQRRFEVRHRSHRSRASHLVIDAQHPAQRLFRLELVGHGPARRLRRISQFLLDVEFVDLYDYAVCRERQFAALHVPEVYIFLDFEYVAADTSLVGHGQPPFHRAAQRLVVGAEVQVPAEQMVERTLQAACSHFVRIRQFQRAGCGISRIGERLLLVAQLLFVESVEGPVGHIYFSPDFEFGRPAAAAKSLGYIGYAQHVFRHVVAHAAVAPRQRPVQHAVPVFEAYCDSVEFQFAAICERGGYGFAGPVCKLLYLFDIVGVAQ